MHKYWGPYFAPPESNVEPFGEKGDIAILEEGSDADSSKDDDDDSEDKSDNEPSEDTESDDEEDDTDDSKVRDDEHEEEKDDEGKEDDEEKDDEKVAAKPALKTITAKYPKLFKEFPALKDAYFRADAYSEVFPSVDDAREAAEKSDTLDFLENALTKQGSSEELFKSIKDASPRGLEKFVENLLPTLYKFDSNLFYKATEPITRQLLWSAKQHGAKTGDKNLVASTQHIANFLFGEDDVEAPKTQRKEKDPEREEFEREKSEFEGRKRNEFLADLNNRAGKDLIKTIADGLDPKSVMSQFMKDTITEKVMDEVGKRLEKDDRHMARMRSLHNRAARAGFPKSMTDQITSAYLSAAKLLIPTVRSEIKQKALGGKSSSSGNKGTNKQIPSSGSPGNRGTSLTKNLSPKQVDWGRTSDLDFLNDKVTLKSQKH